MIILKNIKVKQNPGKQKLFQFKKCTISHNPNTDTLNQIIDLRKWAKS